MRAIAVGGVFVLVGAIALLVTGLVIPGIVALAGSVFLFVGLRTARRALGDGRLPDPSS